MCMLPLPLVLDAKLQTGNVKRNEPSIAFSLLLNQKLSLLRLAEVREMNQIQDLMLMV